MHPSADRLGEPLMGGARSPRGLNRSGGGFMHVLANCWKTYFKSAPNTNKVLSTAVRVEPKTFFANERTLLQWMNTAVLLATISITLLNFGTPSARLSGLIMAPVAIYFILHAYCVRYISVRSIISSQVYARRGRALERKEAIDYTDRRGPLILVVSLVFALSVVVALNIMERPVPITSLKLSVPSQASSATST